MINHILLTLFSSFLSGHKFLRNVSGTVKHGEMCMIMGPSGCGNFIIFLV